MTHARNRSRLLASTLTAALVPAAFVASYVNVVAPSVASAAAAPAEAPAVLKADCHVHAVLASKEGERGIPKELQFLKAQLSGDEFAAYKSFYLLEKKALEIQSDKDTQVKLRTGNRLGLRLLGKDDTRIKLHVDFTGSDGRTSILSTGYSALNGGVLIVGGTQVEDTVAEKGKKKTTRKGKLFVVIQCAHSD